MKDWQTLLLASALERRTAHLCVLYSPSGPQVKTGCHRLQVAFTGSTAVGKIVGQAASKNIKVRSALAQSFQQAHLLHRRNQATNLSGQLQPLTLELGGKSPAIVWKDVDIEQAATQAHGALVSSAMSILLWLQLPKDCCCVGLPVARCTVPAGNSHNSRAVFQRWTIVRCRL